MSLDKFLYYGWKYGFLLVICRRIYSRIGKLILLTNIVSCNYVCLFVIKIEDCDIFVQPNLWGYYHSSLSISITSSNVLICWCFDIDFFFGITKSPLSNSYVILLSISLSIPYFETSFRGRY